MTDPVSVPSNPRREYSVGVWVFAAVAMVAALQFFNKPSPASKIPGIDRGDIVLASDSLPGKLAGWEHVGFVPAPDPKSLPPGQFWWVHQWYYQVGTKQGIVSFDQLGEDHWHELTYCYRNMGWTIDKRTIMTDGDAKDAFAVASLSKHTDEKAILVFSAFFEDGSWATPPDVNLPFLNEITRDPGLLRKAKTRFIPIITFADPASGHDRALQCQVFVPLKQGTNPTESDIQHCIELHLQSRKRLHSLWLDFDQERQSKLTKSTTKQAENPAASQ